MHFCGMNQNFISKQVGTCVAKHAPEENPPTVIESLSMVGVQGKECDAKYP